MTVLKIHLNNSLKYF